MRLHDLIAFHRPFLPATWFLPPCMRSTSQSFICQAGSAHKFVRKNVHYKKKKKKPFQPKWMWVGSQENRSDNSDYLHCAGAASPWARCVVLNSTIQEHKNITGHPKESYEDIVGCRGQDTRNSWDPLVHSSQRKGGWGKPYGGLQLFTGRAEGQHWAFAVWWRWQDLRGWHSATSREGQVGC